MRGGTYSVGGEEVCTACLTLGAGQGRIWHLSGMRQRIREGVGFLPEYGVSGG